MNENPANFRHLRDWYLSHMDDPFPKVDEKKVLAAQKGITVQSLNLWCAIPSAHTRWRPPFIPVTSFGFINGNPLFSHRFTNMRRRSVGFCSLSCSSCF